MGSHQPLTGSTPSGLTPEQVETIKATTPIVGANALEITSLMYERMLPAIPSLYDIFNKTNQTTGAQPRALASGICAYASHIEDPDKVQPMLEKMSHKHASLGVKREHYTTVWDYLLPAIADVLTSKGVQLNDAIVSAWTALYWSLAGRLAGREDVLYSETGEKDGWTGWRDFKVVKKQKESSEITSFYLKPAHTDSNRDALPAFKPGQYISVQLWVPEAGHWQARQYSLSDAPPPFREYYRISVKREAGVDMAHPEARRNHPGLVSNLLHDTVREEGTVRVSHPYGEFSMDVEAEEKEGGPVVLMSAGVGLTPLVSMMNTLVEGEMGRRIVWIHGARDEQYRAFDNHIRELARSTDNIRTVRFLTKPQMGECDVAGRVDLERLDGERDLYLQDQRTMYYVCGPDEFMRDTKKGLIEKGVDGSRVKMEPFGTGEVEA